MTNSKRERSEYFRTYIRDHRRRIKERAVAYKGGKCEECGYDKCIQALEFHHPSPEEKDVQVSHGSYGWDTIKREIEKCHLLCCRCHREIHAKWDEKALQESKQAKTKIRKNWESGKDVTIMWSTERFIRAVREKITQKSGRLPNISEEKVLDSLVRNRSRSRARELLTNVQVCSDEEVSATIMQYE